MLSRTIDRRARCLRERLVAAAHLNVLTAIDIGSAAGPEGPVRTDGVSRPGRSSAAGESDERRRVAQKLASPLGLTIHRPLVTSVVWTVKLPSVRVERLLGVENVPRNAGCAGSRLSYT